MQVNNTKAKYRSLIFSIIIFLLLIASILGLNLYSSIQINKDNTAINAATKMRDNIQGINKDLLHLKLSYGEDVFSPNISSAMDRLKNSSVFFTKAIKVFDEGGMLKGNGIDGDITAIDTPISRTAINEIKSEWQFFETKINDYLRTAKNIDTTETPLDLAVNQAQGSGVIIYNEMEKIVQEVKSTANERAKLLTIIQLVGIGAIILYFLVFIFFFIRRLRQADNETEEARRETADILETVDNGLFLLDKDLNIGSQHSTALNDILHIEDIAGKNLIELLQGIVSKKDINTTSDFIEQLYNPRVKPKLIKNLNPLKKIHVNLGDGEENYHRFLDFNFSRIYKDKEISHILASVNDITDAVKLEKKLEEERRQNDEQIQMVTTILNADIRLVRDFVKNAQSTTSKLNDILKDSKKGTHVFEVKLKDMFREVHSLKGESSALDLSVVTKQIADFEEVIKELQRKQELTGDDFLPLTVRLDDIISQIQTIAMLSKRLGTVNMAQLQNPESTEKTADNSTPVPEVQNTQVQADYYQSFVQQLATRSHKQVKLLTTGVEQLNNQNPKHHALKEIALQLIRNAVAHGIETPGTRIANNKYETGTIAFIFKETADLISLTIEDDGAGIDYESIRAKAIASGQYDVEQVKKWDHRKLLSLIFSSGFSTAKGVTEDAGQGVGLDLVKNRAVEINAKMKVDTEQNKFTRFTLVCHK